MKDLKLAIFIVSLLFGSMGSAYSKLDISFGWFNVTAKTSRTSGKISNLGTYQLLYRQAFAPNLEFAVGYSLSVSKIVSGDMAFGPDLGLYYFPLTSTNGESFSTSDLTFSTSEHWKPFIGGGFHQRQYQSTQASYAGFSFGGGTEYLLKERLSLKAEFRYMNLTGPNQASAKEINILGGLSFGF